jgi:hypothetical protein
LLADILKIAGHGPADPTDAQYGYFKIDFFIHISSAIVTKDGLKAKSGRARLSATKTTKGP